MTDDELDALIDTTRLQVEAEIVAERACVQPDFAAMVARARERNPEVVSDAWLSDADRLAPIVELSEADAAVADAGFDALIHDARELAERDVAARRQAAIPAFARPAKPRRTRWLPHIGLAAALLLLAFALPTLLERFVDAARSEATTGNQAEFRKRESEPLRARPRGEPIRSTPSPQEAVVVPEPEPSEPPEPPPLPEPAPEPIEERKPSKAEQILALDQEAQRRWEQGELEAAAEAYRAIVKLAGRSRHADLAYGDLFTLARQQGDEAGEVALWREYLDEFPKGRFADDARAGLCRRAADEQLQGCWQAYLDDFPSGVHRRSAERALEP